MQDGPERLSFTVFGVVNIASIHMLICYSRLVHAEKRLLTPLQVCMRGRAYARGMAHSQPAVVRLARSWHRAPHIESLCTSGACQGP